MNSVFYKSVLRSVDWMCAVDYFVSFRIFMHQDRVGVYFKTKKLLKNHRKPSPEIDFDQNGIQTIKGFQKPYRSEMLVMCRTCGVQYHVSLHTKY